MSFDKGFEPLVYNRRLETKKNVSPSRVDSSIIFPPASKSIANRSILIASFAKGISRLHGIHLCDDIKYMIAACRNFGADISINERTLTIEGIGGIITKNHHQELDVGESGTCARFLLAAIANSNNSWRILAKGQMNFRPVKDLVIALENLGVKVTFESKTKSFPLIVKGPLQGGKTSINTDKSSQFISALLLSTPMANSPTTILLEGSVVSKPYIEMTIQLMAYFGVKVKKELNRYTVFPSQYLARELTIPSDASGASYFFAWAAIHRKKISVKGLNPKFIQGDLGFIEILEKMGCKIEYTPEEIVFTGAKRLRVNQQKLVDVTDIVPSLVIVSLFLEKESSFRGLYHMRLKECDRINALVVNLKKLKVKVIEYPDGFTMHPLSPLKNEDVLIETFADHRIAMAFSILNTMFSKIRIDNSQCVSKTYPNFFNDLSQLNNIH